MKKIFSSVVPLVLLILFLGSGVLRSEQEDVNIFKADKYIDLKMPEHSLALYMTSLKSRPDDAALLNRIGYAWLCMGNATNAGTWFARAVSRNSTNAVFWNNYGVSWHRMSAWSKAEGCYNHSLEYGPGNPRVLCNLAVALFYQRKYSQCLKSLLMAFKKDRRYLQQRFDRKKCQVEVARMREKYPQDLELQRIQQLLGK